MLIKTGLLMAVLALGAHPSPGQQFTDLQGDYLGQTVPGETPKRFAPDLVSTVHHEHSRIVFSADGLEMYWAVIPVRPDDDPGSGHPFIRDQQNIWFTRRSTGGWSQPRILPATKSSIASSPAMSSSGNTLFFKSTDPNAGPDQKQKLGTLYGVTRKGGEWRDPAVRSDILPSEEGKASASFCFADNGNLYLDLGGPDDSGAWQWQVYYSEYRNGHYETPRLLPGGINDGPINWCPWIAPDESYLIWSSHREGEQGNGDLYVSFHRNDGSWSKPTNLGDRINTDGQERFPSVSPEGRYLFFARHTDNETHSDIFWVDAGIIPTIRDLYNQGNHDAF